ncbi:MAG TPA: hypothetical protein VEP28_06680, partial [Rubrobacter sp.]|nr:hypothetical protein [Rubrobacter sp.]
SPLRALILSNRVVWSARLSTEKTITSLQYAVNRITSHRGLGPLQRIWQSGVTRYDVDLEARTITYRGQEGEAYEEEIPDVPAES